VWWVKEKSMEKFVLLVVLYGFCLSMSANNPQKKETRYYRHEVNVSIGRISTTNNSRSRAYGKKLMDRFNLLSIGCGINGLAGCCSNDKLELGMASASMTLSYYYHIDKRMAVGGFLNYEKVSDRLGWDEPYDLNGDLLTGYSFVRGNSFFLMPTFKYSWMNSRRNSLYLKASCGVNYQALRFKSDVIPKELFEDCDKKNNLQFAYIFTPIGWETGGKKVRWFMELGFGSNTMFQMGLTYRFGRF
jgi:hypothetical protein